MDHRPLVERALQSLRGRQVAHRASDSAGLIVADDHSLAREVPGRRIEICVIS